MKKIPFTLLTLGALVGSAYAEDKAFEFYGIVDVAVGTQSNGLPTNPNNGASIVSTVYPNSANQNVGSTTNLWSGGISQDRIGIKGSTAAGNGWHGGYLLETGFNPLTGKLVDNAQALADNQSASRTLGATTVSTNGSQNGQLINREAYGVVGYDGWGDLRVGRNNTFINDAAQQFDPTQASQIFGFLTASSGFGGGSGISETTRLDNSLKYINKFGDFNVGAYHAWGDGTALATSGGLADGFTVGYAAHDFKVQYAYTNQIDAIKESTSTSTSVADAIGATLYNSTGWLLGGSYTINPTWTVKAGTSHYTLSAPSDPIDATNLTTANGFAVTSPSAYAGTPINARLNWIGLHYQATEKLTLDGGYYLASYDSYTSGSYNATAGQVGWESFLVDYHIDDNKDTYVAIANINLVNTSSTSAITNATSAAGAYSPISANQLIAVGFRVKF